MTTELFETTRLQAGQTLRMAVDAGFALRVAQGCVQVASPPSWLGERMFSVEVRLDEGEVYVSERGGWIDVRALSPAQVSSMPSAAGTAGAPSAAGAPFTGPSRVNRLVQLLTGRMAWR